MKHRKNLRSYFRLTVAVSLICCVFFNNLLTAIACVQEPILPVFAFQQRPDDSFDNFANGDLGILRPKFARSYLIVAYKILNEYKFEKNEREQLVKLWNDKLRHIGEPETKLISPEEELKTALENWNKAEKQVLTADADLLTVNDLWKTQESAYSSYQNCNKSSFQKATETLNKRISKYGANNSQVLEWLKGQRIVFANCNQAGIIPEKLGSDSPEWLQKDRDYQIAASLFYSAKFDDALLNFQNIANDQKSEWKNIANYMIARVFLRKSSLGDDSSEEFLQKAEKHLLNILQDANQKDTHKISKSLLLIIANRNKSENRFAKLSESISQNAESDDIYNELDNYTSYLDSGILAFAPPEMFKTKAVAAEYEPTIWQKVWNFFFGSNVVKAQTFSTETADKTEFERNNNGDHILQNYLKFDFREILSSDIGEALRQSDISDWIFTFQANDLESFNHSFEKWKQTSKTHWLLSAISKAETNSENLAELVAEADKIPTESAAYLTVNYHRIRLLIEQNQYAEARKKVDAILNNKKIIFPLSAKNYFYRERMFLSENLNEFLKFAQRKPIAFSDYSFYDKTAEIQKGDYDWEKKILPWRYNAMFDADSLDIFNKQMSLKTLVQAGKSRVLPTYLQKSILISAWVRAVLLENKESQIVIARHLKQVAPEMKDELESFLVSQTELSAYYVILKFPVMRTYIESGFGRFTIPASTISAWGDNWWFLDRLENEDRIIKENIEIRFLSENEKKQAKSELEKMISKGNASTFLTVKTVELAKIFPNSPQIPEMLHYAVKTTRYGDTGENGEQNSELSKTAFKILHQDYKNNVWTKKTPYWF